MSGDRVPDGPVQEIDEALAEADRRMAGASQPGPSREDMDAASQMSAEDRDAIISGMVARLDERLKENPRDPDGWQRLVRSYVVLGKQDEARDALARGVTALGRTSPGLPVSGDSSLRTLRCRSLGNPP